MVLFVVCCFSSLPVRAAQNDSVLILYDSVGNTGSVGYLNSIFLCNLMGHFHKGFDLVPIENYTSGLMETGKYAAVFYLGATYNNSLPKVFLLDAKNTSKPLVWFYYNLWKLVADNPSFSTHYGFTFDYMDSSGYDQIIYKNTSLTKNQQEPQLGRVTVQNPALVETLAVAHQSATGSEIPYIVHSGNLWYVADIPFSYISENERYLAFADVLFELFNPNFVPQKRAMLRLEGISPAYDPTILRNTADYLYAQNIPFGIALIPYYNDPLGYYTGGVPTFIQMSDVPEFVAALQYMVSKGGTIILNGYTHQYSNVINSATGVSGQDYEFFRVTTDPATGATTTYSPIPGDSTAWAKSRVKAGITALRNYNLSYAIWETPLYTASATDNYYFASAFTAISGRVLYFDSDSTHSAGQFFPYVIFKDIYGTLILPENMGGVFPVSWFETGTRSVSDLVTTAEKNLVVRDAWASFYYHPYLGLSYLEELIPQLTALGYQFVAPSKQLT